MATTNSNGKIVLFNTCMCGNTQLNKLAPSLLCRVNPFGEGGVLSELVTCLPLLKTAYQYVNPKSNEDTRKYDMSCFFNT